MEKIIATELLPSGIDSDILRYIESNRALFSLEDAILYYGFPVFKDYESTPVKSKFALLSRYHGLVLLFTTNAHDVSDDDENLSQLYTHVEAMLKKSKLIRINKNTLALGINSVLFVHGGDANDDAFENDAIASHDEINAYLNGIKGDKISDEIFNETRSIIEGAKALAKPLKRVKLSDNPKEKLNILIELEKEIANFDLEQRKVAISLINGPQRIRGLAGSGKTVVLAMKAAHIHLQHPTKKILLTFHTKSLYGLMRELVGKFYRHFAGDEPNWELVQILHSWGGASLEGVCYNVCVDNDLAFTDLQTAKKHNASDPFRFVCASICNKEISPKYDYILIDEAQDLPNEFFQICYELARGARGKDKNIVWAYDELQSIFNIYQRTPKELFGNDKKGNANIDLELQRKSLGFDQSNDFVLHKCYRNPLEVLITAHALGFGLYSESPVQMLENKEHWKDVGYSVDDDVSLEVGTIATIMRDRANSPLSIYAHQNPSDIIQYFKANNLIEECDWIAETIIQGINEGLRPHDILVISLDDRNAKKYFSRLSLMLSDRGVRSNNLSLLSTGAPPFQIENMVTLSTVHKAKGNEAAMVLAIGVDAIFYDKQTLNGRNKLFTAFTRTKAWLRVSGIGDFAEYFFREIKESMENSPKLIFTVPDPKKIRSMKRDLSNTSREVYALREAYDELIKKGMTREQIELELDFTGRDVEK